MSQDPSTGRASPVELAELAALELGRGHYDEGAEALDRAVLTEPFSPAVTKVLEQAFQQLTGTGQQRLQDAVLRHPHTGLSLALLAVDKGETARALDWCTALVEQGYPDALILQSLILQTRDDFQGALQAADRYVALEAGSPSGYLRRAAVHSEVGEKAAMEDDTDASRSAYERALADYDNALRLAPDLVDALLNRARMLGRMGETARALEAYARVLALAPKLADAHAERGALQEASGNYQDALADYDAWIESAPDTAHAYRSRAVVHTALGHRERAIADYDRALDLMPGLQQARLERAQLRVAEGQLHLALSDYDELLHRDPDFLVVRGMRGDLLVMLGDTTGPDSETMPTAYYRRALDDYGVVTNLSPDLAEPYFKRGAVHARLNDFARALPDFETAISLEPTNVEAHLRRGDALIVLEDNFRALSSYSQAARLDKGSPNGHLGMALAHLRLGESCRLRRSFDKMHEEFEAAISAGDMALELTQQYAGDGDRAEPVTLARSYQGQALRGLAAYDDAIAAFEDAAATAAGQPAFHAALIAQRGETARLWGVLAEQPAKLREAASMLEAALNARPAQADHAWIHQAKGSALVDLAWYDGDLSQYDEALRAFSAALEADPEYGWGHIGRGKAHYLRGDLAAAMSSFREALALDDDLYRPWAEVGVGLVLRQQAGEAESDDALDRAIGTARSARRYLDRADILEDFHAWQLAEGDRRTATTIKPESADAQGALAWSHIQYQPTPERLALAIGIALKAVDSSRGRVTRAANLDSMAWAHHKLGSHELAVPLLEQATQMDGHHVLIRAHLQEALAALDRRAH
jgi:tetratricopeptide (TPR) repeat protein